MPLRFPCSHTRTCTIPLPLPTNLLQKTRRKQITHACERSRQAWTAFQSHRLKNWTGRNNAPLATKRKQISTARKRLKYVAREGVEAEADAIRKWQGRTLQEILTDDDHERAEQAATLAVTSNMLERERVIAHFPALDPVAPELSRW